MSEPMKARCETCVYFDAPTDPEINRFGECKAITLGDYWRGNKPPKEMLAYTIDGSMYKADLMVAPEFGCVLHESRP